jgi:hypothetical protein
LIGQKATDSYIWVQFTAAGLKSSFVLLCSHVLVAVVDRMRASRLHACTSRIKSWGPRQPCTTFYPAFSISASHAATPSISITLHNMTSRAFSQGAFLIPETSVEEVINDDRTSNYRHPTVYDAVAGISILLFSTQTA